MSLMDRLRALNPAAATAPNVLGASMVVRFTPEAATGESLAVGVIIRTPQGEAHARWLTSFDRIRCAFGHELLVHLPLLLNTARDQVEQGRSVQVPLLSCTAPSPVYGDDLTTVLDALFTRFVPLARPHDEHQRRPQAFSVRNTRLQKTVFGLLRRHHGQIADSIIAKNPELSFPNRAIRTVLHVPLQGIDRCAGRFGTIVSAQAARPEKLALNIHPAAAELNTAATLHKVPERGLFILRPREGSMPDEQYEAVDNALSDLIKIYEAQGMTVCAEINEGHISEAVKEWSERPRPPSRFTRGPAKPATAAAVAPKKAA